MRVCRREALLELDVRDRRFGYPVELLQKATTAGWRVSEHDVGYHPRALGTRSKVSGSVRGTTRAARDFWRVLASTPRKGPMSQPHVLVVAKAPEAGRVKTRLGARIGMDCAAEVAAAALLDTLAAATDAVGAARCHLSLDGDLAHAVRGPELEAATAGWTVHPQTGGTFAAKLADAHARVPGPVVQVGMDTPHLTPALLLAAAAGLEDHDAVLGPAEDGGWWVLALREPARAAVLRDVPMSTPTTCADTRAALAAAGLDVGSTATLRDVDEPADADAVSRLAPRSRFAHAWRAVVV
jgi:glycosyltransferase A (GT-A) superfamily protein (DUF2064 family)